MTLKLITLNIEGDKHLDTVLPFLKKEKSDVVCLQEIFKDDFNSFKNALGMEGAFFPMCRVDEEHFKTKKGTVGIAYFTRLPHTKIESHYYFGKGCIPKHMHKTPYSKDLVLAFSTMEKDRKKYIIGTTHFTWTPNGQANEEQWNNFSSLMKFVKRFDELILCGDFNAPRGREIFTAFAEHFIDHLPKKVDSTLDPKLHRVGHKKYVVDTIFSTPQYKIKIEVAEGVSDHMALVGEVRRIW